MAHVAKRTALVEFYHSFENLLSFEAKLPGFWRACLVTYDHLRTTTVEYHEYCI